MIPLSGNIEARDVLLSKACGVVCFFLTSEYGSDCEEQSILIRILFIVMRILPTFLEGLVKLIHRVRAWDIS
jgi:hypothetical protein